MRMIFVSLAIAALPACNRSNAEPTPPPTPAVAPAPTAPPAPAAVVPTGPNGKFTWKDIQPVFADGCDRCHGPNPRPGNWVAKAKGKLDTSTYPFGGQLGAESLDRILEALQVDSTGRRKMPMDQKGDYPDDQAQKITQWIMDGALNAEGMPPVWPTR